MHIELKGRARVNMQKDTGRKRASPAEVTLKLVRP